MHPGTNVGTLESSPRYTQQMAGVAYRNWFSKYTLNEFIAQNHTTALLVLKDNQVVWESYHLGASASTRFLGYSMTKTVLSLLIGVALDEGSLGSVSDPVTKYLPDLKGTAYDGVTIEHLLQMTSGVAYEMTDDSAEWQKGEKSGPKNYQESFVRHQRRYPDAASSLPRSGPVGQSFSYSDMDAAIATRLLETATGRTFAEYLEEKLWKPAGMESEASVLLDGPVGVGKAVGAFSLCATARDYARIGLLMANGGKANGRQIVPEKFLQEARRPHAPDTQFGKLYPLYPAGYGYFLWLFPEDYVQAEGAYGQFIRVGNDNTVIVKLSAWPNEWDDGLEKHWTKASQAIIGALNETKPGKR